MKKSISWLVLGFLILGMAAATELTINAANDNPGPVRIQVLGFNSVGEEIYDNTLEWDDSNGNFSEKTLILPDETSIIRYVFLNDLNLIFTNRDAFIDYYTWNGLKHEGEDFDNTGGSNIFFPGCVDDMYKDVAVVNCDNSGDWVMYIEGATYPNLAFNATGNAGQGYADNDSKPAGVVTISNMTYKYNESENTSNYKEFGFFDGNYDKDANFDPLGNVAMQKNSFIAEGEFKGIGDADVTGEIISDWSDYSNNNRCAILDGNMQVSDFGNGNLEIEISGRLCESYVYGLNVMKGKYKIISGTGDYEDAKGNGYISLQMYTIKSKVTANLSGSIEGIESLGSTLIDVENINDSENETKDMTDENETYFNLTDGEDDNETLENVTEDTGMNETETNETETNETLINETSASEKFEIEIKDDEFFPDIITISAKDTVTWENSDAYNHTVVGDILNGEMEENESYSFTFEEPGTYEYVCTLHPGMEGTIIVE